MKSSGPSVCGYIKECWLNKKFPRHIARYVQLHEQRMHWPRTVRESVCLETEDLDLTNVNDKRHILDDFVVSLTLHSRDQKHFKHILIVRVSQFLDSPVFCLTNVRDKKHEIYRFFRFAYCVQLLEGASELARDRPGSRVSLRSDCLQEHRGEYP